MRIQSYDHQELRRLAGELLPAHNLALDLIQLIGDSHGREVQIEQWGAWLPYDFDWMLSHSGLRVLADRVQGIGLAQELLVAPDGTSLLDSQLATLRQLGLSLQVRGLDPARLPDHAEDLGQLADLFRNQIPAAQLVSPDCGTLVRHRRARLLAPPGSGDRGQVTGHRRAQETE